MNLNIKDKLSQINRRNFLRGTGVTIALPLLDFMADNPAYAQEGGPGNRFLVVMNGMSISRNANGAKTQYVPDRTGTNYDLKRGIRPIGDFPGLQSYISIASNLYMPFRSKGSRGDLPAAAYRGGFHRVAMPCQLTGHRIDQNKTYPKGPSSDRLFQDRMNYGNKFRHINVSAQASSYTTRASARDSARSQYTMTGSPVDPETSPRAFFQNMFSNVSSGAGSSPAERARIAAIIERKSIIDLLDKRRVEYLNRISSSSARQRLESHFDHIREIERQLDGEDVEVGGNCVKPLDPGPDPRIGPNYAGTPSESFVEDVGYSDEDKRADLYSELISMAFACDISRAGTYRLTFNQSFMSAFAISGGRSDYHQLAHYRGSENNHSDMLAWHTKHYCKLLDRLRSLDEPGGNILDTSAIVMINEGGGGENSDGDDGKASSHSGYNMASMIAGKAGGLVGGRHFRTDREHPTKVLITAMKAAGMPGDNRLNEVNGTIPEFFG